MKKKSEINKPSGASELNSKLFSIINRILKLWHNQYNKFAILSLRCTIFNSIIAVLNLQLVFEFCYGFTLIFFLLALQPIVGLYFAAL